MDDVDDRPESRQLSSSPNTKTTGTGDDGELLNATMASNRPEVNRVAYGKLRELSIKFVNLLTFY